MTAARSQSGEGVDLRSFVRDIPDFPSEGIVFKDITPLLLDARALDAAVSRLTQFARDLEIDLVVAAEARGFILGGALARGLGAGFVPARKRGKLPHPTVSSSDFAIDYGIDALEVHSDALAGGVRVLIHDDLLATGATASALADLVKRVGGEVVACAFVVELRSLRGRERLAPYPVHSLVVSDE